MAEVRKQQYGNNEIELGGFTPAPRTASLIRNKIRFVALMGAVFWFIAFGYIISRYQPILRHWTAVRGQLIDKKLGTEWSRGMGPGNRGRQVYVLTLTFRLQSTNQVVTVEVPTKTNLHWLVNQQIEHYEIGSMYDLRQNPLDPSQVSLIAHIVDLWSLVWWIAILDLFCWFLFFGLGTHGGARAQSH